MAEKVNHAIIHSNYWMDWVPFHERKAPPWAAFSSAPAFQDLRPRDVVWIATEPADTRRPSLCGRLVVASAGPHAPGADGYDPMYGVFPWIARADRQASEYCRPFPCHEIGLWEFWNSEIRSARMLNGDQARVLQESWDQSARQRLEHT